MRITYRDQISIDIDFQELDFLRRNEPVAWAELAAGIARVGFVLSVIDIPDTGGLFTPGRYGPPKPGDPLFKVKP
jgi:hypothetical protein